MATDKKGYKYINAEISTYKQGLDHQRELFKQAKINNDYDTMCDCLENIEAELSHKLTDHDKELRKRILTIIDWYRTLETRYIKNTPEGKQVIWPSDIHNTVNKNLTVAYRLLIKKLGSLGLL